MSESESCSDEDCDLDDVYYSDVETCDMDIGFESSQSADPEHFDFDVLKTEGVEKLLNESVAALQSGLQVGLAGELAYGGLSILVTILLYFIIVSCLLAGGNIIVSVYNNRVSIAP